MVIALGVAEQGNLNVRCAITVECKPHAPLVAALAERKIAQHVAGGRRLDVHHAEEEAAFPHNGQKNASKLK
jgi:hypothetical protein